MLLKPNLEDYLKSASNLSGIKCGGGGGGGQGGGSPGEQGAGGVRETGEERAGGGISTMAGSGREIQKGSQRNEPNNVS